MKIWELFDSTTDTSNKTTIEPIQIETKITATISKKKTGKRINEYKNYNKNWCVAAMNADKVSLHEQLLQNPSLVNLIDPISGMTPLHLAYIFKKSKSLEYLNSRLGFITLLKLDINVLCQNIHGRIPSDYGEQTFFIKKGYTCYPPMSSMKSSIYETLKKRFTFKPTKSSNDYVCEDIKKA
ncbi:hypothetical protein HZS_5093 [Henneguya salminicola]|nr:hypothetical protein HZS_5093 [Henneguya salminicola]